MSLGVRLKELRIKKGKSLQEVADAVGASKAHVWDMETGRSKNPSIELLLKLAKFFWCRNRGSGRRESQCRGRRVSGPVHVPRAQRAQG